MENKTENKKGLSYGKLISISLGATVILVASFFLLNHIAGGGFGKDKTLLP